MLHAINYCRKPHLTNAYITEAPSLQILLRELLSRDQIYYSCSSEACQKYQKLNSFTPFSRFTTQSTNSIPKIILHPKKMQYLERLVFFFVFLNVTTCHLSNLRSINLIRYLSPLSLSISSFFHGQGFVYAAMCFFYLLKPWSSFV